MLSPLRSKNGCGSTSVRIYRSPGGPPFSPEFPLPGTRTREPLSTPGGILTSKVSGLRIRPVPLHVGHRPYSLPEPLHWGHVCEKRIAPAVRVTFPEPPHIEQVTAAPPLVPLPPQVPQISSR